MASVLASVIARSESANDAAIFWRNISFERLLRRGLLAMTGLCMLFPIPTFAHPLDIAYLDLGRSGNVLTLTVAIHPYQAYELIRGSSKERFDLHALQQHGDMISAYVQDHVNVLRGNATCTWDAGPAHTPETELEAVGDGVTIQGELMCPNESADMRISSSVFLDGFPQQTSIIRFEYPEGFAEQATLDRTHREATVNLSAWSAPSGAQATSTDSVMPLARRPDAALIRIAQSLVNPGLNWFGFFGLLASGVLIGALHALGPGHGKSVLAATLVGERATIRRVLALGSVMTITHVSDVFLMAIFAGVISSVLPPTQLLAFLEFLSAVGLCIFGAIGLIRSIARYRAVRRNAEVGLSDDAHARAHALGLPHTHGTERMHVHEKPDSFRRALWLGFVGSLAPCPTAWAMFMATLAVGKLGAGILLLVAFTVGLHLTILAIGLLLLYSKSFALRRTPPRFTYALPVISAMLVSVVGVVLLYRALA